MTPLTLSLSKGECPLSFRATPSHTRSRRAVLSEESRVTLERLVPRVGRSEQRPYGTTFFAGLTFFAFTVRNPRSSTPQRSR